MPKADGHRRGRFYPAVTQLSGDQSAGVADQSNAAGCSAANPVTPPVSVLEKLEVTTQFCLYNDHNDVHCTLCVWSQTAFGAEYLYMHVAMWLDTNIEPCGSALLYMFQPDLCAVLLHKMETPDYLLSIILMLSMFCGKGCVSE